VVRNSVVPSGGSQTGYPKDFRSSEAKDASRGSLGAGMGLMLGYSYNQDFSTVLYSQVTPGCLAPQRLLGITMRSIALASRSGTAVKVARALPTFPNVFFVNFAATRC